MPDIHDDQPIDDPVYQRLVELEAADLLTPEVMLAEAADPSSPFHAHCNWDDPAAAHQHRLSQMRHLIARYKRVRITSDGETVRTRAFTHVESVRRYHDTDRALRDWREEVMASAKRMMEMYALRYQRLGKTALLDIAREVLGDEERQSAA